ncbi:hypothetical protein [Haladaptatus cibarius]|uniref:hypothetical protein n=1 Tax=Haladaptatus cibarius TaxID=453847 RepID=UPI0006784F59|nr:hypothetical protein [Haladaptatus cibarius]
MPEYTLHVPSIRGATKESPDTPYSEEDFPMDDMADIDDYFLLSTSEIPPESFEDLHLPVAHLDQRLSLPLLQDALDEIKTLDDLDDETKAETIDMIHDLGECFPNDGLDG